MSEPLRETVRLTTARHGRGRVAPVVASLVVATLLAACGSSSHHRASASRGATAGAAAASRVPGYNALPDAAKESDRRHLAAMRWEARAAHRQDRVLSDLQTQVVVTAVSMIGTPYRWGGNEPGAGLDCSGLVSQVFRSAANLPLPRTSVSMSREGSEVPSDGLSPGDLVFFNTTGRFSHVGIYVGEGRFVHAPSSGGRVRLESLDARYWTQRFQGARRLIASSTSLRREIASRR